ncbi:hypothetical protein Tco_1549361 [Tanacetum coccineum]
MAKNLNGDAEYRSRDNTRRTVPVETSDALVVQDNALIVQDGLGYDWSYIAQDEPTEFALMAYTSNSAESDTEANLEIVAYQLGLESVEAQLVVHHKNEVVYEEKIVVLEFKVKDKIASSDGDDNQTNDRFKKGDGYHVVPPPFTGNYMPPLADLSFAGLDDSVYRPIANKTSASVSKREAKVSQTSTISVEMPKVKSVRSDEVLIKEWVIDDEDVFEPRDLQTTVKPSLKKFESTNAKNEPVKSDKQAEKPRIYKHLIKDCDFHEKRMTQKSVLKDMGKGTGQKEVRPIWNNAKTINHQNKFVPSAVLTRSGRVPVSAVKQSFLRAVASTNAAKLLYKSTAPNTRISNEKVNAVRVNGVNTARQKAVSAVKENRVTALKASNKGFFESGCSRHMTGNKDFFYDYQDIDEGFVAFGGSTKGGCRLISWQCKKQTVVANSTTKAEYIAASNCYGQLLMYIEALFEERIYGIICISAADYTSWMLRMECKSCQLKDLPEPFNDTYETPRHAKKVFSNMARPTYAKIPKLYRAYELCDKNEQLHVFDSEETLEDAEKSRLKMNEFQKDEKVQELKIKPIDYGKLNKLYDDFVPQKEPSAEQTYFPSSFISSKEFSSEKKPSMASMPSANPMLVDLNEMENVFKKLFELLEKNSKRTSIFYTSLEELRLIDICVEAKLILQELHLYFEIFQNRFKRDVKEMKDVFVSVENDLDETLKQNEFLKDRLLEASLAEDVKNLVITSCVEIRNKDLHDEIERISKESKDVSNESKTADTVCNDAFEVTQELSKRIVELEKDLSKFEAKSIAFEIALQHKSRENNSLKTLQKENENFMASLQIENAHLKQTYKDLFESVQRSRVETNECDEVKVKVNFDEIETKNIELEHRVASLIKENEHLKLTYQSLFDSIKKSRVQTKTSNVTQNEAENLRSQLFEFAETKFNNILGKIEFFKKNQFDSFFKIKC